MVSTRLGIETEYDQNAGYLTHCIRWGGRPPRRHQMCQGSGCSQHEAVECHQIHAANPPKGIPINSPSPDRGIAFRLSDYFSNLLRGKRLSSAVYSLLRCGDHTGLWEGVRIGPGGKNRKLLRGRERLRQPLLHIPGRQGQKIFRQAMIFP